MNNTSLLAYAVASVALCAQLLFLWFYSGLARAKTKTAMNREDAAHFGATLVDADPPAVARILRVHANSQACVYPFLVLGLIYVLLGGGPLWATILFAVFIGARLLHTFMYLNELQPWRMIAFLVGFSATVVLAGHVLWLTLRSF